MHEYNLRYKDLHALIGWQIRINNCRGSTQNLLAYYSLCKCMYIVQM